MEARKAKLLQALEDKMQVSVPAAVEVRGFQEREPLVYRKYSYMEVGGCSQKRDSEIIILEALWNTAG